MTRFRETRDPRRLGGGERRLCVRQGVSAAGPSDGDGRAVVAVLNAIREQGKDTPEARTAFDRTCTETLAYLRQHIEALRFTKAR
jgi:hypothetical protein